MKKYKETIRFQIVWGFILMVAGVGVFYRIPQVMPKLAELEPFVSIIPFIKFCFYLIGIILIGGGIRKVHNNFVKMKKEKPKNSLDNIT